MSPASLACTVTVLATMFAVVAALVGVAASVAISAVTELSRSAVATETPAAARPTAPP